MQENRTLRLDRCALAGAHPESSVNGNMAVDSKDMSVLHVSTSLTTRQSLFITTAQPKSSTDCPTLARSTGSNQVKSQVI